MQYPFFDFLGASLVPELGPDVAAGSSCHIHFGLVFVLALGALPDKLSVEVFHNPDFPVIPAHLAVVAFGVQLCIHDIVINVLHYRQDSFKVILQVRHFHIADSAPRGQLLELGFKGKLVKGVHRFAYMHMVAVGDIIFIRYAGEDAKPFLQASGKLIGSGLQRRPVKAESDIGFLRPFLAGAV